VIFGGDCNVPQGDRVFKQIENRRIDSFDGGARGWCNTIADSIPLLRIDQIWTSEGVRCVNAYVRKAAKTDHKMYIAEFGWTE